MPEKNDSPFCPESPYRWRRWANAAAVLAVAGATALSGTPADAGPSGGPLPQVNAQTRAIELVRPSVVYVRTEWHAWVDLSDSFDLAGPEYLEERWASGCTGVVVGSAGYILTAGHCVDPGPDGAQADAREYVVNDLAEQAGWTAEEREDVLAAVKSGELDWPVKGSGGVGTPPESEIRVRVGGDAVDTGAAGGDLVTARLLELRTHRDGDVALLKIDDGDLPVAELAPKPTVEIGEEVLSIGYPLDRGTEAATLTSRNGKVSSIDSPGVDSSGNVFYETSAELSQGMSGGPTVGLDGKVIGIASFTLTSGTGNFLAPTEMIGVLLTHNGVENTLGTIDESYRSGLENYYRGYYSDAIADFDKVLQLRPEHKLAFDKRRDADALFKRDGDRERPGSAPAPRDRGVPAWGLASASGAALIALVAVALLLVRRRSRRAAPPEPFPAPPASPFPVSPAPIPRPAVYRTSPDTTVPIPTQPTPARQHYPRQPFAAGPAPHRHFGPQPGQGDPGPHPGTPR